MKGSPFFTDDFASWLENLPQERWEAIAPQLLAITALYMADRIEVTPSSEPPCLPPAPTDTSS
jgi:hypothetical protein